MDERNIPDPVLRPNWKKTNPRGTKGLVRDFVLKRLQEGRLTDREIAEEAAALYSGSTSVKAVQWYKFQFKKKGLIEDTGKHRRKRKFLVNFTYEIIFKQVDPPDNVAVVDAKRLVLFAQSIVRKYARILPKPVDEIVYDVRTAKHYLEASGRFEVIDQNNYDETFCYKEVDENGNVIEDTDEEDDLDEE